MGVNSLPETVTRQHRGCDLNPGPAPESNTLTTRPPSDPIRLCYSAARARVELWTAQHQQQQQQQLSISLAGRRMSTPTVVQPSPARQSARVYTAHGATERNLPSHDHRQTPASDRRDADTARVK